MPHLSNKQQKIQTQSSADRITTSLSLAIRGKINKQTNKNSAQISLYTKVTQTTGPTLGGGKIRRKKDFNLEVWEKETSKTINYIYITQMNGQIGNTEVQISEEEIGNLPEKEFRTIVVKMIKNLENKVEKMQESI